MAKTKLRLKSKTGDKVYEIDQLEFINIMVDVEDKGVNVIGLITGNEPTVKSIRTLLACMTHEDDAVAGRMLAEHMLLGGDLSDILRAFNEAGEEAGFGETAEVQTKAD